MVEYLRSLCPSHISSESEPPTKGWLQGPSPSSKDPYYIWMEAGLPEIAKESVVIQALDDWAILNAYIYSKSNYKGQLEYFIQWVNPQGYIIKTHYDTFRRWILCACCLVEAKESQNLSVNASADEI